MNEGNYQLLMQYAMRALGRRAHTVHEMRTKLKRREQHTPELEEAVIWRLTELKLLDDQAFVTRMIEDAVDYRFQGPYKIKQRLLQKGIHPDIFQHIWDEMKICEADIARDALKKFNRKHAKLDKFKAYEKRARYLASRGFSPSLIYDLAKDEDSM